MADYEERIPLGNDMYIDTARPVIGHFAMSEDSSLSDACFEQCDPEGLANFLGQESVASLCMRNAMEGGGPQETIVNVEIQCKGPKRRLLGSKKCGAKTRLQEVALPFDLSVETEEGPVEVPEIMPGVTFASLVESCIAEPDRTMEHDGLLWGDKVVNLPGVSPITHIAVGSRDGIAIEIDVNQSSNPFTPARIQCDLSGSNGELKLKHNEVADEGGREEHFAIEDRASLDARVTELFKNYFVKD